MSLKEDIRPVTYLKSKAAELLEQINRTRRPVVITQKGRARAVMQDPESYERMRMALGLLKLLAQAEQEIRLEKVIEQEELFDRLEAKLRPRSDHK